MGFLSKINNLTASVNPLEAGNSATASLGIVNEHYHLTFGIPRGQDSLVVNFYTRYAVSTSGTEIPESWQTDIPYVPGGSYLWSRTTIAFNDGTTGVFYSKARSGLDGSGALSSINGVGPNDANMPGNILIDSILSGANKPNTRLYLVGAAVQENNPETGTNSEVYIRTDGGIQAANFNGFSIFKSIPESAVLTDTWKANTTTSEGYVSAAPGQTDVYWGTDANGEPAWVQIPSITNAEIDEICTA